MKNFLKITVMACLVILSACSKDEESTKNDDLDKAAEALESTPLEANKVSDNVKIVGGTKEDGMPPTPNEAISLDLSNSGKIAYLNEGFELKLKSDANITGAYIQFRGIDGTVATSYYDVNLSSNNNSGKSIKKSNSIFSKTEQTTTLDVDFNTNIPPGTFCYVICVYDAEGNISAPQEVCVTVESWGGNSAIIGAWNFKKMEETEDGVTETIVVGEKEFDNETWTCSGQGSFDYEEFDIIKDFVLTIDADGSYKFLLNGEEKELNYNASSSGCSAIYKEVSLYTNKSEGNWAYIASENHLTMVEYFYSYEDSEGIETDTYLPGEADLLFDGTIQLNGNSLVIIIEDDYDGDGVTDELSKYYFEK
ncbi:MAG: hypothetical protein V3U92_04010 [Cellulophaga sp.]